MFYLKNKYFVRWVRKQGITDHVLCAAIREFENGLFDGDLGNHLFKKRIALPGMGKRGGVRTILFYSIGKYKIAKLLENSFPMQQRRYDDRREEFSCQAGAKLIFCFGFS